jgi:hypothetical protein
MLSCCATIRRAHLPVQHSDEEHHVGDVDSAADNGGHTELEEVLLGRKPAGQRQAHPQPSWTVSDVVDVADSKYSNIHRVCSCRALLRHRVASIAMMHCSVNISSTGGWLTQNNSVV